MQASVFLILISMDSTFSKALPSTMQMITLKKVVIAACNC